MSFPAKDLSGEIMRKETIEDKLICALDIDSFDEAKDIVERLDGVVSFFKVGIILQVAVGDKIVEYLLNNNKRVFLDLKYYDVPETVEKAVGCVAQKGVSLLTIHGNGEIIKAAVKSRGDSGLRLLAVTALTSLDSNDLRDMGYVCSVEELVKQRVKKAVEYGCDGVISSPNEIEMIRNEIGSRLLIVTPGVRLESGMRDDHKRVAGPAEAIRRGADYLVVGRPITLEPDPREAALRIVEDMRLGLA